MSNPFFKASFAGMVLLAIAIKANTQYVDAYNKSGTGPNMDRGRQEAANREASKLQEQRRHEQYEADRKAAKNNNTSAATFEKPSKNFSTIINKEEINVLPKSKYDEKWQNDFGLTLVRLKDKYGFIDNAKNEVIPLIYDEAYFFRGGLAAVKTKGKFGFIDESGKIIIPLKYDYVNSFYLDITTAGIGDKETYINKKGLELFPMKYNYLKEPFNGLIEARLAEKVGYIDITGKEIIPVKYDSVVYLEGGSKKMYLNGEHYYFDKNGSPSKHVYDYVSNTDEYGEEYVELNYKWGKTDRNSKVVIPIKYDMIRLTENGMTGVYNNGQWGFVNRMGKEIISPQFDSIFSNFDKKGFAIVQKRGMLFSINKTGEKIKTIAKQSNTPEKKITIDGLGIESKTEKKKPSPFADKYIVVGETSQGLAAVMKGNKWGYINTKGVVAIPLIYDYAFEFENGLASVSTGAEYFRKWGYINLKGKVIIPVIYEDLGKFSNGLAAVRVGYKWGYINEQGIMTIQPQYESAMRFNDKGIAEVIIKDEYYFINKEGEILGKK